MFIRKEVATSIYLRLTNWQCLPLLARVSLFQAQIVAFLNKNDFCVNSRISQEGVRLLNLFVFDQMHVPRADDSAALALRVLVVLLEVLGHVLGRELLVAVGALFAHGLHARLVGMLIAKVPEKKHIARSLRMAMAA
jgi:hypothetical protein